MLRLHWNRHPKSGHKFHFNFSNFKALQVPKGWEKLFVSIVSDQTGKTIVRSSKSSVRYGSCQWTESLSESIWVLQDEISKKFEDCNYKLVVSMGSGRSNILGEAMVNMTSYTDSKSSALSLPLINCNHGTTLLVTIQCLTPRTKVRSGELKQTNFPKEDLKKESHDSDGCSDITNCQFSKSIESPSGADLYSTLHSGEAIYKEPRLSASYSQLSNDSSEIYESVENDTAKSNDSDIQRRDSLSSQNSALCLSPNSVITASAEAATIEELRAEKLMSELDKLKKEFSDQSQIQESLNYELSAATVECDDLRKELAQLKLWTLKSSQRRTYQDGESHILIELKDELKFQKESSADLAHQLQRSQESNIELLSVLQEVEECTEKQKLEMEELLAQHRKDDEFKDMENKKLVLQLEHLKESEKNIQSKVELLERNLEETKLNLQKFEVSNRKCEEDIRSLHDVNVNLVKENDMLKEKMEEVEKDCDELTDENLDLLYKLKQANNNDLNKKLESMKCELEVKVEELSKELTEKKLQTEKLKSSILSKENEIKILGDLHNKLQDKYLDLQNEKKRIDERMEVILGESDISSKCINDLRNEVEVLNNENKIVEGKSSELECEKRKLEFNVSQMEQERINLSDHVSVLESQLKSMTDENESIRLEFENSKSCAEHLVDERNLVQKLNGELKNRCAEAEDRCEYLQRENTKLEAAVEHLTEEQNSIKKLNGELKNQFAEAQDQFEYLQRENTKLKSTAEHLVEEQNLIKKLNGELKKKNFELHECYLRLESKLKGSLERSAHYFKRLDDFEDYLSLGLEEFTSKERFLSSELNSIVEDDIKYKEKFAMFESLYSEAYLEKATKAEELQGAVVHLTKQLSATKDDLNIMKMESDEKLTALISELSSLKQNQETLITDHEKLLKQLENYKSLEVKLKNSVNELELKLSVSEKERKQHEEELMKDDLRNGTYQQKLKILEEEKDECLKRCQSLEAELKHLKEEKHSHRDSSSAKVHSFFKTIGKNLPSKDVKLLKNDGVKTIGHNHSGKKKALKTSQSHERVKDPKDPNSNQFHSQIKDDSGCDIHDDGHRVSEVSVSRFRLLEKELAVALEAKKKYEDQLNRLVSYQQSNESCCIATVVGERNESINSAMEAELKDIRERYFHISLKYAEVENQREELVMKLKEAKNGERGWFS